MSADSTPRAALSNPWVFLGTGFGLGLLGPAPGTLGAALGLLLVPLLWQLAGTGWLWGLLAVLLLVGVPICGRAAQFLHASDPGPVIWDEMATMPLVYLALPAEAIRRPWVLLLGFVLHRVFDIVKPPPVRWLEGLPGGWGIMLDDVAAALFALVSLGLLHAAIGILG